jgi:hypothetical protein
MRAGFANRALSACGVRQPIRVDSPGQTWLAGCGVRFSEDKVSLKRIAWHLCGEVAGDTLGAIGPGIRVRVGKARCAAHTEEIRGSRVTSSRSIRAGGARRGAQPEATRGVLPSHTLRAWRCNITVVVLPANGADLHTLPRTVGYAWSGWICVAILEAKVCTHSARGCASGGICASVALYARCGRHCVIIIPSSLTENAGTDAVSSRCLP